MRLFSFLGSGCGQGLHHSVDENIDNLHSMFLRQLEILPVEHVDAVNHLLNQLDLRISESVLVGDVIGDAGLAARLAPGSPGLQVQLLATSSERLQTLLGPAWKINVDRGPHACSQVGGAGVDVTVLGVQHEVLSRFSFDAVFNGLDTTGKAVKDGPDVSSHLHGYDTELVLLIHPGEEGLVLIVEDSTTLGPITLHASDLKVGIAGDEEEVVVNQLLSHLLIHASEREVGAGKVALQVGEGLLHQVLHSNPLLLGDARRKTETVN